MLGKPSNPRESTLKGIRNLQHLKPKVNCQKYLKSSKG